MAGPRLLSIAAASRRVGHVFFIGGRLIYWGGSDMAIRSPEYAARTTRKWIGKFRPQIVVTEKIEAGSRKGENTIKVIGAIAKVAADAPLSDIAVPRIRHFESKYEEAKAIAKRYPAIAHLLPKKRPALWESEPRQMIFFEATALALGIVQGQRPEVE